MHIPDGFLSPEVAAGTAVVATGAVAMGLRRAGTRLGFAFGNSFGVGALGVVRDGVFGIGHGQSSRGAVELQEGGCASRGRRKGTGLSRRTR